MHIKQQTCDQQLHFFSLLQVIFDPLLPSVQDLIFPPPPLPQPSVTGTHSWHSDEESVLEKGLPQLLVVMGIQSMVMVMDILHGRNSLILEQIHEIEVVP